MKKEPTPSLALICVDDEQGVLDALVRDLAPFEDHLVVEAAASADEARDIVDSLSGRGCRLALILCDHLMPGTTGTDFLIELNRREDTRRAAKVLVTAQAGLEDTVRALNEAGLDHYIAKPWNPKELHEVARKLLTDYVLTENLDPMPWLAVLEVERVGEALSRHNRYSDG